MEFVRGAQSTLYGSDAMTSVVQVWTRAGSTRVPELRFGADGGNFGTASGYASLAGARGRFDYNVFGRPVQYQRLRHQRRLLGFARRRECRESALNDSDLSARSLSSFQQSYRVAGRVELQRNVLAAASRPIPSDWSQLNNLLGSVELAVAAPHRDGSIASPASTIFIATTSSTRTAIRPEIRLTFLLTKSTTSIVPDSSIRATIRNEAGRTPRSDIAWRMKMDLWADLDYGAADPRPAPEQ